MDQEKEKHLQEMESDFSHFQAAVNLLKPLVQIIEQSPPQTKDHYAKYMVMLAEAPTPELKKKLAAVLISAGANKEGVISALALV